MVSLDAGQLAIVASSTKTLSWLFEVTDKDLATYKWSTKNVIAGGVDPNLDSRRKRASSISILLSFIIPGVEPTNDLDEYDRAHIVNRYAGGAGVGYEYDFKIIDFDGITITRPQTEAGIMPPSELTFSVINKGNVYSASDFEGGYVTLSISMGVPTGAEEVIRSWKFLVKKVESAYQLLKFTCEDFFQQYVEGNYPYIQYLADALSVAWLAGDAAWDTGVDWNAAETSAGATFGIKVRDIFPATEAGDYDIVDDCCIPQPFGNAYVPIRSAYITDARYYVIGPTVSDGAGITYTILECRTPREYSGTAAYYPDGVNYSFTQETKQNAEGYSFKVFEAIIVGGPPATDPGLFDKGDNFYDLPTWFTRSDTETVTNPADVIQYVLEDIGVATADIDATTFGTAETTYTGWGLEFNGAFWKMVPRDKALTMLLSMCHSTLVITDKVELRVMDATSVKTITSTDIMRGGDLGMGTYRYQLQTRSLYNCGNVLYSPTEDSQDAYQNVLVAATDSKTNIDPEGFEMPFVQDATIAANIARLFFQRKLLKKSQEQFTAKATCIALEPGDFITISGSDYGGSHDVIIDSMKINRDCSIDLTCTGFAATIEDYP